MALPLDGLADALRAAGLAVREYPGWKERTQRDGSFRPVAVMWHHDATPPGDSPSVLNYMANLTNNGAQTWVDRYGTWHLIASGRMWHAGGGGGWGRIPRDAGNLYAVGVETDHTTGEDWPAAQLAGLRVGTAVLLKYLGAQPGDALCGHKEYRTSNPDPDGLDMAAERRAVAAIMAGRVEDYMALTQQDAAMIFWHTPFDGTDNFAQYLKGNLGAIRAQVAAIAANPDVTPQALEEMTERAARKASQETAPLIVDGLRREMFTLVEDALQRVQDADNVDEARETVAELLRQVGSLAPATPTA